MKNIFITVFRAGLKCFIKRPFKSAVFPGVSGGGRESPKDGPGKDTKSFNIKSFNIYV